MKNRSRLTALLLALVMLLSITASATELGDYTKSDYDADVLAVQSQTEEVTPASLTATDSGFNFAVTGEVPENAQLYVTYMGEDTTANIRSGILGLPELEEGMSEYAFDITIVENNAEWQPGTPVEVTITGVDTTEDSEVLVYHIPDPAQPAVATLSLMDEETAAQPMVFEEIEATAGEGAITFMADGFSIYYVQANGTNSSAITTHTMRQGETITFYSTRNNSSYRWYVREGTSGGTTTTTTTLNSNGGSQNVGSFTLEANGNSVTVTANRAGSIRLRYGSSWSYSNNDDRLTVTATEPILVTFNANGGTGGPYTIEAESDGAFMFPTLEETRIGAPNGMKFAGWSAETSGKGDTFSAGIECPDDEDSKIFYALWYDPASEEEISAYFHIRIDNKIPYEPELNQGQSNYTTPHALRGTIKNPVSINNNLDAVKENIASAPTAAQINAVRSNTVGAGQKVVWYVIKWNPSSWGHSGSDWHVDGIVMDEDEYLVVYHPNGGNTSVPAAEAYLPNATVTVDYNPLPERTGYDFLGWSEDQNAKTPTYSNKNNPEKFTMPEHNVDLYAVWKPANGIPYKIEHYFCDEKGENADLHETEALYGTTEEQVTAAYKTYEGYVPYPEHVSTVTSGKVAPDGSLVLKLYYKEKTATINYVPVGPAGATNFGTVTPESETVKMVTDTAGGSTATAYENYTFAGWYSDEACTQLVGNDAAFTPEKVNGVNVAATYYAKFVENTVTINYVAVGPEGLDADGVPNSTVAGSVSSKSETVMVLTGIAAGSTATASSNTYKFVGWYYDAACTRPAGGNATFVPAKVNGVNVAATYYAKFDYNVANLTISKEGMEDNEAAIFTVVVEGKTYKIALNDENDFKVVIPDLTIGSTYTITEDSNWSWRYNPTYEYSNNEAKIVANGSWVKITNSVDKNQWLSDESSIINFN